MTDNSIESLGVMGYMIYFVLSYALMGMLIGATGPHPKHKMWILLAWLLSPATFPAALAIGLARVISELVWIMLFDETIETTLKNRKRPE